MMSFQLNYYAMLSIFHITFRPFLVHFVAFISHSCSNSICIRQSNDALPTWIYTAILHIYMYLSIETTCGAVHTMSIFRQFSEFTVCVDLFFSFFFNAVSFVYPLFILSFSLTGDSIRTRFIAAMQQFQAQCIFSIFSISTTFSWLQSNSKKIKNNNDANSKRKNSLNVYVYSFNSY